MNQFIQKLFGMILFLTSINFTMCFAAEQASNVDKSKYGNELVFAMANSPLHLNPAIISGSYVGFPGVQLFASPLRFDDKWHPQPYLAEKWKISKNGLSVTLHLVKDATFHDGWPITSKDIEFSIITVRDNHPFSSMFSSVEKVDTPDPHTAIIRLKNPHPAILLAMSSSLLPIIPKHIYGDGKDIKTHPANMNPVGSGPFKFVEFIPGDHILLERYDNFFIKGRPYLNKVRFKICKKFDPLSMTSGHTHIWPFYKHDSVDILENDKNLLITSKGYEGILPLIWIGFNMRKKPFDDIRVRQALAYSIDRELISKDLFKGKSIKATGPIGPDHPFYTDDVEHYNTDIKKANELLDAAGYVRNKNSKRFSIKLDYIPRNITYVNMSEYIKDELLRKSGIEVNIRHSKNFSEFSANVSNGHFDMVLNVVYNWGDPVIGVHRTYDCNNIRPGVLYSNTQGYCNPIVNKIMDKVAVERDFQKRKSLYKEFQKIIVQDLPIYYLLKLPVSTVYNKNVFGLNDSIWGLTSPFDCVWIKKENDRISKN